MFLERTIYFDNFIISLFFLGDYSLKLKI